ncbi:MAG: NAD(P)-dependent oxidoreductase [Candidatus Binatus sp.]|uniref:NAD(P)-dependent oxidoreductase n=1 Tax=Candidatus Binatus sp. TaxID=2811406 RepID=UPI002717369D|nr:NAD(P)-dependent oxidoreductase [Candidatus Binatus sp.]MDO8431381.1 NAD(P)-dependent oxidoreductase [Candidatus Binatus sp.]
MTQKIGFVGLGAMGLPMASNLIAAGYQLTVYNRTASKAEPLLAHGAHRAARAGDVARPGGIVVSMLADDASLEALVAGEDALAANLGPDGIHVSMSTVSPAITRKLARVHAERESTMIAAPVFGRPNAAAAKKLWICTSGPADAKARVRPLLEAMGQGIFDFGEDPDAANVVKLAGNFMIAASFEAISEALTMVQKSGVDPVAAIEMLMTTLFASPVYQGYGAMIAHRKFTPAGFRLPLGLKDIDLVLKTAAEANVPMPAASLLRDRFLSAIAKGRADLDWSAIALGAADDAGLKVSR